MSDHRYLVSARKYRPSLFAEVVGQEHVTETLKNAIRLDRLAHAYLFSGPRGVGKTTGARILAKAINCETPLSERTDESEPCQTCNSCVTFDEGRSMNVIEVDAASNNKVDDIRELRETVRIPPQGAKRKVYIIDEVHMLSASAFNALLKTLEEPPPYVLFIFATTEPHKVLPTILSRCQRFDYRRITIPEIVAQLEMICKSEKIKADEASLMLIARKGDGALRDALSAFDQAVALCGSDIRYDELAKAFRVVDVDIYFDVTDSAATTDSSGMLQLIDRVVTEGYDLHEFLNGLLGHLRNIYVARTMKDTILIEATADVQKQYAKAAKRFGEPDLLRMMTVVADTEESIRYSAQPRLTIELGLLKLVHMASVEDLQVLIDRAKSEPGGQTPGKTGSSESPGQSAKKEPTPERSRSTASKGSQTTAAASSNKSVSVDIPASGRESAVDLKAPRAAAVEPVVSRFPDPDAAFAEASTSFEVAVDELPKSQPTESPNRSVPSPAGRTAPALSRPASSAAGIQPLPSVDNTPGLFGPPALKRQPRSSSSQDAPRPTDGSAALAIVPVPESDKSVELREIESVWLAYVRNVKNDRIHVGALLQHSSPAGLQDGRLSVSVPDDFHRRLLTNQEEFLRTQLCTYTDLRITELYFAIRADLALQEEPDDVVDFDPQEYVNRKCESNPMIRALFDEFGGELIRQ